MTMEHDPVNADTSPSLPSATCRVAIIGSHRPRVAKVASLLHADAARGHVATTSLPPSAPASNADAATGTLPPGVAATVTIEYLPCVATFDSYEDESGATVRYLAKLEYHGPNGTLAKGKSLAPFFDDVPLAGGDDNENPFPGIVAAVIGCGIEDEEDVARIRSFLASLSAPCEAHTQTGDDRQRGMVVECVKPNPEYASMKEENEAFRGLSQGEKTEAIANGTIGPAKMATFVVRVSEGVLYSGRGDNELPEHEPSLSAVDQESPPPNLETLETQTEPQTPAAAPDEIQPTAAHAPNPEKKRYACKRCRAVLFGEEDLEDPPHAQSQHHFCKWGPKAGPGHGAAVPCQNHCLGEPLPWMQGCGGTEGKLHCPKCRTKVGHYAWTGAQCSCGTWVTPAIMVPVSRVDEKKPVSHDVIVETGALFLNPREFVGVPLRPLSAIGAHDGDGLVK